MGMRGDAGINDRGGVTAITRFPTAARTGRDRLVPQRHPATYAAASATRWRLLKPQPASYAVLLKLNFIL
jgi:hypothetical protein